VRARARSPAADAHFVRLHEEIAVNEPTFEVEWSRCQVLVCRAVSRGALSNGGAGRRGGSAQASTCNRRLSTWRRSPRVWLLPAGGSLVVSMRSRRERMYTGYRRPRTGDRRGQSLALATVCRVRSPRDTNGEPRDSVAGRCDQPLAGWQLPLRALRLAECGAGSRWRPSCGACCLTR
jgi:hypothetical protein